MIEQNLKNAPVVHIVNDIIFNAVCKRASDIHLETNKNSLRVRFRIDGVLYDYEYLDQSLIPAIITRIKICAHLNIAEKRIPQDGKFSTTFNNRLIDLRVSTFPSIDGEKVVIRILDRAHQAITLDQLGFGQDVYEDFLNLISRSSGFFLVTGPTGSGKTTTLYAALSHLNTSDKHIITLEDPVEYNLDSITQGHIRPEAGFTFEAGVRAILRQDPDVAMIGEIRDKQTVRVAIEGALSGHLMLSTLHTNNAPGALMRLIDMGIEPFLINGAVTGVLAQRLARKICVNCKQQKKPTEQDKKILDKLGIDILNLYEGHGCDACLELGYKGRVGIFELLVMKNSLQSLLMHKPVFDEIYKQAIQDGMQTLLQDGIQKVQEGIISLPELVRALS